MNGGKRLQEAKDAIREAVNRVLDEELVKHFPEAMSGNTDPADEFKLHIALDEFVHGWAYWNLPRYRDYCKDDSLYRPAEFTIDDDLRVKGFTAGELWNGWSCPRFERDAILEWLTKSGNPHRYDEASDTITIYFIDANGNEEADPEVYGGYDIEVGGEVRHVYAVGAWGWCWWEVKSENPA